MSATSPDNRRSFLGRLSLLLGASTLSGAAPLPAQTRQRGPLVHEADAWMDALPSGHRMVFDAITAGGAANAGRFCSNWFVSNASGYGLKPSQLGAIVVLRSAATIFAFTDAMWAKYPQLGDTLRVTDPATSKPYAFNPFLRATRGDSPSQGVLWETIVSQGAHFAVCNGTTTGLARGMAGGDASKAAEILQELTANQIANAHQMATGIVALGRAQEKGFTFGGGA
jgi:hypothetical protein